MIKNIVILSIFLLLGIKNYAQRCNYTFWGTVLDFHNKKPIVDASIYLKNLNRYITTDINGVFFVSNLCNGTITLEISHVACETKKIELTIDSNLEKTFYLEHHLEELNEVIVKADNKTSKTSIEQKINQKTITKYSDKSFADALQTISGVSTLNTGNSIVKPMIHGLHSSRVIILNNGTRQEDQEWGVEHSPSMDVNAFGNIKVIKGAGALKYGSDAVGGVVVAEFPKMYKKDTIMGNAQLSLNTNGRGGNVTNKITKGFNEHWQIQAQGSFRKLGDFEAPNYVLSNTGTQTEAFSMQAAYQSFVFKSKLSYSYFQNEIGILRTAHIGSLRDLAGAINAIEPRIINPFTYDITEPRQEITHHLANWENIIRIPNLGKLNMLYSFQYNQRYEYDIRRGDRSDEPAMNLKLTTQNLDTYLEIDKWDKVRWEIGLNGMYQLNSVPYTGIKRLIPDYQLWRLGMYSSIDYNISDKWIIEGGIRYDYSYVFAKKWYDIDDWEDAGYDASFSNAIVEESRGDYLTHLKLDYHGFAGIFGTTYKPSVNQELNFNFNVTNRIPNPSELFSDGLHHSAAAIEIGDLNLGIESSKKFTLNHKVYLDFLSGLNIETTVYWNQINNFINQIPTGADFTIRGAFPVWSYIPTDITLTGFDIDIKQQLSNSLTYTSSFAYLYAQDIKNNIPLINMPSPNWQNGLEFSNSKRNYYINLNTNWVFEQKRFADFNFPISYLQGGEIVSEIVDVSTPPEGYFLVNFLGGKKFKIQEKQIEIQFGVENIFNTSYRNYLNRLRYFADELGRNFQMKVIYTF